MSNEYDNVFDRIVKRVLGRGAKIEVDDIEKALDKVSDAIVDKNAFSYTELVRNTVSKAITTLQGDPRNPDTGNINFDKVASELIKSDSLKGRFNRYRNVEDIIDNIPYCSRALTVLTDNIISPDDIKKDVLKIYDEGTTETDRPKIGVLKSIKENLDLDYKLRSIVKNTLMYGDCFVEICDVEDSQVRISQMITEEGTDEYEDISDAEHEIVLEGVDELGESVKKSVMLDISIEANYDKIMDERIDYGVPPGKTSKIKYKDSADIGNLRLNIHPSSYVVAIQSHAHKTCLGYLIFPAQSDGGGASNIVINRIIGSNYMGNASTYQGIDSIYIDIVNKISKFLNKNKEDMNIAKGELNKIFQKFADETDQKRKQKVVIRYVSPEKMQHFHMDNDRFYPYGESIFFKSMWPCKLLIALETAITIRRITDSSDKRIITIESSTDRNVRNVIEDFKEATKKRKYSVDTMGNIGAIPSMVTNFEEYYIPRPRGQQPIIEFDTLPPQANIRDITDELKFFRDQIVSSLDVPPTFLNIEENLGNKSALAHESDLFARTVISYQMMFTRQLEDLLGKVFKLVTGERIPYGIVVTFSPPRLLQVEREGEHYQVVSSIIQSLSDLGISRNWLKEKYLDFDWEEIEAFEIKEKMNKKISGEEQDESQMGGGMGGY